MPKSLVIVESPTKARTISQFLDDDYVVESSIGHVRDLPDSAKDIPAEYKKEPWARTGVDIDHDFKPLYIVPPEKKKQVDKLRRLLADAERVYLATDEDREGESISWHLTEVLRPQVPALRLVFHEITREAIRNALRHPREIDQRLVRAQETRRILDRLYGYELSPLLWRKVAPQLSAGRVQSVAIRMLVQRERSRMAFKPATYWDLGGTFDAPGDRGRFAAELVQLDGKRLVSGKDFDDRTGRLAPGKADSVVHLDEAAARGLAERLAAAEWQVEKAERKPYTTSPPAPFTTSTLQQEANRKLHASSRETMRTAQALYERGYITYMRTDSTTLSEQAVTAARAEIQQRYGAEYLPGKPRVYRTKVRNAQEAHEAIRPAGDRFRAPDELRAELSETELRLYEMIWKRTMACQMADARGHRLTLQVAGDGALFQATGRTIDFPGYLRAYVEGSDDPSAELSDQEKVLPDLKPGDRVTCAGLEPQRHTTQAPARFTEASLVKELEKEGIGRPSTYATIIDTILRRDYVIKRGSTLIPTFTAFAVVQLLERHFPHLVDTTFTARMEEALDDISNGERQSLPYLRAFFYGDEDIPGLHELLHSEIDAREVNTIPLGTDAQGRDINIRVGRYGPYLERGDEHVSIPAGTLPDELTVEQAETLLQRGNEPDVLGVDPASGRSVYLKTGRYGPYVQLGEADDPEGRKMKSLLPGQAPEEVTLDDALRLLSLPRTVGTDPDSGEDVVVDLGRYGPYVRRGKDTRSLSGPEQLFTLTVDEAAELFRQEKAGRRGRATVVRTLGAHPQSGAELHLMTGRYGPYVTDGEVNASVPRQVNPDELKLEDAVRLVDEKRAKGGGKKTRGARKAAGTGSSGKGGGKGAASARKGGATATESVSGETPAKATGKASGKTAAKGGGSSSGKGTRRTTKSASAKKGSGTRKTASRQGAGGAGKQGAADERAERADESEARPAKQPTLRRKRQAS